MGKATREKALRLLSEKKSDPGITYSDIEIETGYSRRQLMRLSKRLDEAGADSILVHGIAVDDATTGVLAGWFMERECMRGYARMMREVVTRHGVLRAMYSDKDSVFRAVKDGSPTQLALMMRDLGIHMIFANSPQAKGRVERYNSTVQMRLPTDLIRFGVAGYDGINGWFNDFYACLT